MADDDAREGSGRPAPRLGGAAARAPGFVDPIEPNVAGGEETTIAPAWAPTVTAVPAHASGSPGSPGSGRRHADPSLPIVDAEPESGPALAEAHQAADDLEGWWGPELSSEEAPPDWDGDAPIAVALDGPPARRRSSAGAVPAHGRAGVGEPPRGPSRPASAARGPSRGGSARADGAVAPSDVFEAVERSPVLDRGLTPRAPSVSERSAGRSRRTTGARATPAGVSLSQLAREAERARRDAWAAAESQPERSRRAEPARPRPPPRRRPPPVEPATAPPRRYPMMLALLADPDSVPHGSAPPPVVAAPPVPGTFFPVSREPRTPDPDTPDVDAMLGTMAEGLYIGGDGRGLTEVVVTLRDDFFRGTELHVQVSEGRVGARLVPPDYDVYRQLSAELPRLRERLERRGLSVSAITVDVPS